MFKTNESNIDRMIRVAVGVVALILFFTIAAPIKWLFLVVGVLGLFTGIVGWCALYSVFGVSTCKMKA